MATPRRAILIFGRFQPPTKGHERLFNAASTQAERTNATVYVFPSLTQDARNPLSYRQKVQLLTPALRSMSRVKVGPKTVTNPAVALTWAKEQGITDVLMYVGDDRLDSFRRLARSWSQAEDPKGTLTVKISSMPRTGAWDASKISGTAARSAARANDFKGFQAIVISRAATTDVKDAMRSIQRIAEEWEMELDIDFGHPPMLTEEDESFRNTLHAVFETDDEDDEDASFQAPEDPPSNDDSPVFVFDEDENEDDDASLIDTLPAVFETDDDEDVSVTAPKTEIPEDEQSDVVVYNDDEDDLTGTLHAVFETDEDPAIKDETLGAVRPRVVEPPNTEVIAYPQSGVSVEVEPPLANNGGKVPSDTPNEKSFVVISPKRHLKHDLGVKAQERQRLKDAK